MRDGRIFFFQSEVQEFVRTSLFHTGMRISEFCGLTLKDIDLENRIINIDHQLQRVGIKIHIETTKTNAGTRKIPMTEEVYRCQTSLPMSAATPAAAIWQDQV